MGPRRWGGCLIKSEAFPEEPASEARLKVARRSGKGDFTKEKSAAHVSRARKRLADLRTCIYGDARETDT